MSEVKLPRSVQKQVRAADALLAQAVAADAAAQPTVSVEALGLALPAAEPVVIPPVIAPVLVETPPVPAPAPDMASQLAASEQRFRTLQGMMNKDVGTLRSQVSESMAAITQLTKQLEAAQTAQPNPVDPKDMDTFGAELVDMVRRQSSVEIKREISAATAEFSSRLGALEQQLQGTSQSVAVNAEHQFYAAVTAQVPDWRTLNAQESFLVWLGEMDPVYGLPRQAALDHAVKEGSVNQVVAIFNAFKKTAVVPAPSPASELQSQVEPARSGGSQAPAPAAVQYVSEKDIIAFYESVRRGAYRGKESEMQQIETNINVAIAEGRVRF